MKRIVLSLLAVTAVLGCAGGAADGPFGAPNELTELAPFQGEWKFDEGRTFAVWTAQGKGKEVEDYKKLREGLAEAKEKIPAVARLALRLTGVDNKLGELHTDLNVTGDTFVGTGALAPEYRLFAIHRHDRFVCGKAWFHEDRHDPGDMSKCWVRLERVGDEFHFHVKTQDDSADVENDPDVTSMPITVDAKLCEVPKDKVESSEWTTYVFVRPESVKSSKSPAKSSLKTEAKR